MRIRVVSYTLTSADGTVEFSLQHNVQGRRIYAAVRAVGAERWPFGHRARGNLTAAAASDEGRQTQHLFSMVDVLKAGAMK